MVNAVLTRTEFVTWLKNSIGHQYDFDGWYGFQCYDYANAGWSRLFPGTSLSGTYAYRIPYDNQALLNGRATIHKNTPSFLAQAGDMVIFPSSFGGGAGHVAWVVGATLNYIVVIEQNWQNGGYTYGPYQGGTGWETATKRTHPYDPNMIFIRPNFKANKATAAVSRTVKSVAQKRTTWNWKGRFYPDTLIKVRRGAGLNQAIVGQESWLRDKNDWVDITQIKKVDGYWWGRFKYPTNPKAGYFYCAVAKITDKKQRIKNEKSLFGRIKWK